MITFSADKDYKLYIDVPSKTIEYQKGKVKIILKFFTQDEFFYVRGCWSDFATIKNDYAYDTDSDDEICEDSGEEADEEESKAKPKAKPKAKLKAKPKAEPKEEDISTAKFKRKNKKIVLKFP
jgi:hypothetical protein